MDQEVDIKHVEFVTLSGRHYSIDPTSKSFMRHYSDAPLESGTVKRKFDVWHPFTRMGIGQYGQVIFQHPDGGFSITTPVIEGMGDILTMMVDLDG